VVVSRHKVFGRDPADAVGVGDHLACELGWRPAVDGLANELRGAD